MNSTGAIERQSVGRHATLGALYDIRTDTLEGTNLFNKELPSSLIKTSDNAHLSYELDFNNSQIETFNKFNIEVGLKLSLLSGLANIGESAKFLKQTKIDGHTIRVTFICKVKTKQENLQISMADLHQYFSPDALENPNATHVVIGIMWGANVVATFERIAQNREQVKEIEGKLSLALKSLPISGEAGVKYKDKDNSELESLQISFSGDLLDEACSGTIEGVMDVFKKIPTLIKPLNDGKGQQLVFILYPLERMAQIFKHELQIDRLIQEVSDSLAIRVENIFDEISTGKRKFNDFLNEIKPWEDYISHDWQKSIREKQMELTAVELETRSQLSSVLKNIRGGQVEESEMEKLLDNFDSENSCSLTSIDQFLKEKTYIKLKIQTLSEFDRETNLLKELTSIVGKILELYDKKVYLLHISHKWATEDEQNSSEQFQFFKHLMNTETTHSEQNSDKETIETAFLVIDYDLHHADLEHDPDRTERCCIYYAKDGRIESKDYYDYSQKFPEFAAPSTYKELHCKGRPCAKCGKCRDWHFTGDMTTWDWIRNSKNWNDNDWKRYDNACLYHRFKRRDGATCTRSFSTFYFHIDDGRDPSHFGYAYNRSYPSGYAGPYRPSDGGYSRLRDSYGYRRYRRRCDDDPVGYGGFDPDYCYDDFYPSFYVCLCENNIKSVSE